jgi:hypothetical protein
VKKSNRDLDAEALNINFAQKPIPLLADLWTQLFVPYQRGYVLDGFAGTGNCFRHIIYIHVPTIHK